MAKTYILIASQYSTDSFLDSVDQYKANKETNLYESHGNAYAKLATIPKDTVVTSAKRIGDWYNVTFNETPGYIYIGDFSKYSDVYSGNNRRYYL